MIVSRKCEECKSSYDADTRYLKRGQGTYCSKPCASAARSREMTQPPPEPNVACAWCEVPFYLKPSRIKNSVSGVFTCSNEHRKLAQAHSLFRTGPRPLGRPLAPKHPCPGCGVPYKGFRGHCKTCYRQDIIDRWLAGDNEVTLTQGKNRETKVFVKRYLLDTRGDCCEVCGFDEKAPDGRSIIQMDHVDGDCFNNSPDNLQLLCPNHHAMTPTYGSLNTGSGRAHRRKQPA
jgi:hypothetical protein